MFITNVPQRSFPFDSYSNFSILYASNKHPVYFMTRDVCLTAYLLMRNLLAVSASMAVPTGSARSSRSNLGW